MKTLDQIISNLLTQSNARKRSLSRFVIKEIGCKTNTEDLHAYDISHL